MIPKQRKAFESWLSYILTLLISNNSESEVGWLSKSASSTERRCNFQSQVPQISLTTLVNRSQLENWKATSSTTKVLKVSCCKSLLRSVCVQLHYHSSILCPSVIGLIVAHPLDFDICFSSKLFLSHHAKQACLSRTEQDHRYIRRASECIETCIY